MLMKLIGMVLVQTPRLRKTGEKTLMYVKNGCEKITSEMFYSHMLHQVEKIYQ